MGPAQHTNKSLMEFCISKLAEEGIDAFVAPDEDLDGEVVLRVPALEKSQNCLCRKSVFAFIHGKLNGNCDLGLRLKHPATGADFDIYCYDPDLNDKPRDAGDLLVWSPYSGGEFDWTELVDGDDSAWTDGWEMFECDHLDQRIAFLGSLMSYEVIELPKIEPLTLEELRAEASAEMARGGRGRHCNAPNPNDTWRLRLDDRGALVLHMGNTGESLPITAEHIDDKGRLVIDGHVALTRSTPW